MRSAVEQAGAWLEERRLASSLAVRPIPFAECAEWIAGDEIRHRTGRYFQVVGVSVEDGPLAGWQQPLLRQTEVGILGFLVRPTDRETEWLVQAKTEPGNVGGTQLAPSVQATQSNYMRVHGGAETRHLGWFVAPPPDASVAADLLASEQGTRFLHKANRNVVVETAADVGPLEPAWRWLTASTVRALLTRDFRINTDARSVIVTAPWRLIAGGSDPFQPRPADTPFRRRLVRSAAAPPVPDPVLTSLTERQSRAKQALHERALSALRGWSFTDRSLSAAASATSLICVAVTTEDREIAAWCQPLLHTDETTCDLWCAPGDDGVLRFAFRYAIEPGLIAGVELGPTSQSDAPTPTPRTPADAVVRLEVRQSDEGGRFACSVCHYRIVELPRPAESPDLVWLTVADIAALIARPMTFTNEARSAVSLLVSLA